MKHIGKQRKSLGLNCQPLPSWVLAPLPPPPLGVKEQPYCPEATFIISASLRTRGLHSLFYFKHTNILNIFIYKNIYTQIENYFGC